MIDRIKRIFQVFGIWIAIGCIFGLLVAPINWYLSGSFIQMISSIIKHMIFWSLPNTCIYIILSIQYQLSVYQIIAITFANYYGFEKFISEFIFNQIVIGKYHPDMIQITFINFLIADAVIMIPIFMFIPPERMLRFLFSIANKFGQSDKLNYALGLININMNAAAMLLQRQQFRPRTN